MSTGNVAHGGQRPRASPMAVHWRLDPGCVFLNHGSFGATPAVILDRQREIVELMERDPVRFFVQIAEELQDRARHAVARLVNADAEGIARMANATAGVNTVLGSLRFDPGDEILTNTHEYNACNNAVRHAAEKWGARVVSVDAPFPVKREQDVADAVLGAVTSRTRLALISHVTSPTGVVFPVQRVVDELNRCGIESLIDGAHAPGMIPIDLTRLNATYYAGNLHKWMCAPKGAAFLWVREDRRADVRPLVISHGANSTRTDRSRFRLEFDYVGTSDLSAFLCVPECVRFLGSLVPEGLPGLMQHNHLQALKAREILCRAVGAEPSAPERMLGSMASVHLPTPRGGIEPSAMGYHDALHDRLLTRHGVQAPVMLFPPGPPPPPSADGSARQRLIRVSMQAYNSLEQVEYLAGCLKEELEREAA